VIDYLNQQGQQEPGMMYTMGAPATSMPAAPSAPLGPMMNRREFMDMRESGGIEGGWRDYRQQFRGMGRHDKFQRNPLMPAQPQGMGMPQAPAVMPNPAAVSQMPQVGTNIAVNSIVPQSYGIPRYGG
jgi:hypothetical protein